MPVMTRLQHWDHDFRSPFKSEIYFVSTTRFTDLKWGTRSPIMLRDPEFGPYPPAGLRHIHRAGQ